MRKVEVRSDPEPLAYGPALDRQLVDVRNIQQDPSHPYLLRFLEHRPVYTLGHSTSEQHFKTPRDRLENLGFDIVSISRGGSVTYHGPGQLVVYVHLHLKELKLGLARMFRELEDCVIECLKDFEIPAFRREKLTGVWTSGGKICAMGLAASRFVTYHGLALNYAADLKAFEAIVPCGLDDTRVVSIESILKKPVPRQEVELSLSRQLSIWLEGVKESA